MLPPSFQEELTKIAASRRGGIDLSEVHRKNLEDQREDLLDSEGRYAYLKGGAKGTAAGLFAPTLMLLPAMTNPQEVGSLARRQVLSSAFEKALKNNPDIGMSGKKAKDIQAAAFMLAQQYESLPSGLKRSDLGDLMKRVRVAYPNPRDIGYVIPKKIIEKDNSLKVAIGSAGFDASGDLTVDPDELSGLLATRNEHAKETRAAFASGKGGMHIPGLPVDPKDATPEGIGKVVKRYGMDVDDGFHFFGHKDFDQFKESLQKKTKAIPDHPSRGVMTENELTGLLNRIGKRHGKGKGPSNVQALLMHSGKTLRGAAPAVVLSGLIGASAGLASVRNKRRKAAEIRSRSNARR